MDWAVIPCPVVRSPLFTAPSTRPAEKPAAASHSSIAAFAQDATVGLHGGFGEPGGAGFRAPYARLEARRDHFSNFVR